MSSSRNAKRVLISLMAATLLLGACRSDGGIGRRDTIHGMRWTLDTLAHQHRVDGETTSSNIQELSDWFESEVTHPTENMRRTMNMYLEGNPSR